MATGTDKIEREHKASKAEFGIEHEDRATELASIDCEHQASEEELVVPIANQTTAYTESDRSVFLPVELLSDIRPGEAVNIEIVHGYGQNGVEPDAVEGEIRNENAGGSK